MLQKKSKPLFTQQQVISVQDIHFFLTAHTHGSYILSTHQFQSRKIEFLGTTCRGTGADFFYCPFSVSELFSTSNEVIELCLQGSGHFIRFWATAAFFLIGVFRRLISRFLCLLLLLVIVLLLLGFFMLTFVAPTDTTKDDLGREL